MLAIEFTSSLYSTSDSLGLHQTTIQK